MQVGLIFWDWIWFNPCAYKRGPPLRSQSKKKPTPLHTKRTSPRPLFLPFFLLFRHLHTILLGTFFLLFRYLHTILLGTCVPNNFMPKDCLASFVCCFHLLVAAHNQGKKSKEEEKKNIKEKDQVLIAIQASFRFSMLNFGDSKFRF